MKKNKKIYLSASQINKFLSGENFENYKFMGSRLVNFKGKKGALFCVWAPNAKKVSVVGSFNNWDDTSSKMYKVKSTGIWCRFIEGVKKNDIYKYKIYTKDDNVLYKADPYALYSELRPNTASVVVDRRSYNWSDTEWLNKRKNINLYENPMNIYEIHLGSWKRKENNDFYSYREIADLLVPYVKEMNYTHVEIMPVSEHPLDASWGYQCTGYYSLTSRYGSIDDFKYFVNKLHMNNIGVIIDWVPGHFCKDEHGLYKFDGTYIYEYENEERRENYEWGTANFDLGKPEVQSFLISNAVFWFDEYHIDGIRVDAVANMLYLDYGKPNSKIKNKYGGIENLEAIEFLKKLNKVIFEKFNSPLMIAEESTAWPLVTYPTYLGGLGFNYKWNMGWMNDMLKYMQIDPLYRKYNHNLITFSIMYTYSENFILPLSHDEVVHGKKSLLDKMPGEYYDKFSNLRLFYGYMMSHPGKKMLFMGGEFGQFIEWRYDRELDWELLKYPIHDSTKTYVKDLNSIYLKEKSLWELDHKQEGFSWIDQNNYNQSIVSFIRKSRNKDDFLVIICNFTKAKYEEFKVGVPRFTFYKEILNSDRDIYGGSNFINKGEVAPIREKWNGQPYCVNIKIAPFSCIYLKPIFLDK